MFFLKCWVFGQKQSTKVKKVPVLRRESCLIHRRLINQLLNQNLCIFQVVWTFKRSCMLFPNRAAISWVGAVQNVLLFQGSMNLNTLATNWIEGPSFRSFVVELSVFDEFVIIIYLMCMGLCVFVVLMIWLNWSFYVHCFMWGPRRKFNVPC